MLKKGQIYFKNLAEVGDVYVHGIKLTARGHEISRGNSLFEHHRVILYLLLLVKETKWIKTLGATAETLRFKIRF